MFDARSETLAIVLARRPFGILDVNRALPRGALGILRGAFGTLRTAGLALTAGLTRDAFDTAVDAAFDGIGRRPTMAPFPAVAPQIQEMFRLHHHFHPHVDFDVLLLRQITIDNLGAKCTENGGDVHQATRTRKPEAEASEDPSNREAPALLLSQKSRHK
eukprot:scaffold36976_cov239-Skeletonema_dohrnii-CCMP3373.AAC.2